MHFKEEISNNIQRNKQTIYRKMTSIEICLQYYRKRNAAAAVITSILMPNTKKN